MFVLFCLGVLYCVFGLLRLLCVCRGSCVFVCLFGRVVVCVWLVGFVCVFVGVFVCGVPG